MRAIRLGLLLLSLTACQRGAALGYVVPPSASDPEVELGRSHTGVSAALRASYRPLRTAPLSLATDGGDLELRALAASIRIEGPLAHTELRFTFRNPEPRTREGRFSIALPPSAALDRFAMKLGDTWREARIVTRERGREVYERFLHRGVDPALLEQDLGNQFSARVFPIAPSSDKELVVAYDHPVSSSQPYTLSLEGLPPVPLLSIEIDHDGQRRAFERGGAAPEDVVVPIAAGSEAVAGDDAFVARIEPSAPSAPAPLDRVLILVDTSASRAPLMGRQVAFLQALVAALPPDATVAIAAFDHAVDELYRGAPAGAPAVARSLYEHGALGASDLGAALSFAASSGLSRVVLLGDGAPTLGEHEPARLASLVRSSPILRVDAIPLGPALDREALAAVVAAGRDPGAILDGRDPVRATHELAAALPPEEPIRIDGATAFPATTRGQPPGEPLWVAGHRTGAGPLVVRIGARTVELAPRPADPPRTRRTAAKAELAALTEQLHQTQKPSERTPLLARIEALALANHLVSVRTSLLVLESDADEQRMLTPAELAPPPAEPALAVAAMPASAPIVDTGSTRSGITITEDYLQNIPVARAYGESMGELLVISGGATSLENTYVIEGLDTAMRSDPSLSPLALSVAIDRMRSTAAPFGMPWRSSEPDPPPPPLYTGELAAVMSSLARGDRDAALSRASRWQLANPGDVAAILALGESLEARGAGALAARAYGSLLDLFPTRADLLRTAGERLDRIAATVPAARALTIDAYRRALRERPDQPTTYRLLAYALLRAGRGDEAIDVLGAGLARSTRPSVTEILAGDAGLIAAHLVALDPAKRKVLALRMMRGIAARPSLRIVLSWETDANDVDLHVRDRAGGHAFFSQRHLPSGGDLLDDLTDGYGPEMFVVDSPSSYPYRASVHYYRRGPMGLGLGTAQVIRHDGAGHITVEDRPFVLQSDGATLDLGPIRP